MASLPDDLQLFRQMHKLMEISRHFFQQGNFESLRERLDVRHREFLTLIHLYNLTLDEPEGVSLKKLTHSLHISQPTASMLVSHLVERGHVSRRENPRDRRQTLLTIPPAQREGFDRMARAQSEAAARVLDRLPEGKRELLMDFINTLYGEFSGQELLSDSHSGD